VVSEAREFGIKLILTLTDSRGDFGGMSEYVRSALGEQGTIKDFYSSKVVRVRKRGRELRVQPQSSRLLTGICLYNLARSLYSCRCHDCERIQESADSTVGCRFH